MWRRRCEARATSTGKRCKLHKVNNLSTCQVHAGDCSICISSLAFTDDTAQLSCGHRYHAGCIHKWIDKSTQCPICRRYVFRQSHVWTSYCVRC